MEEKKQHIVINYIFNISTIFNYPEILTTRVPNVHLWIPSFEMDLIISKKSIFETYYKLIELIKLSSQEGFIKIINCSNIDELKAEVLVMTRKNEYVKSAFSINVNHSEENNESIYFVSHESNDYVMDSGRFVFIQRFNLYWKGTSKKYENYIIRSSKLNRKIIIYNFRKGLNLVSNLIIALAYVTIAVFVIINFRYILNRIGVFGVIFSFIFLGFWLFKFRERHRLIYGFAEVLFGILGIIWPFYQFDFDYSKLSLDIDLGFKIIAGLYIMVRGQDNVDKGLTGTFEGKWLKELSEN